MTRLHVASALVRRGDDVLLVASRYRNHAQPLWNLPGGRQQPDELLGHAALRELAEETGLQGELRELCYVSESYGELHVTNFTFSIDADGTPQLPNDPREHVVDAAWVPIGELAARIAVRVVREPLLAFLNGTLPRYAGYPEAGVSIEFFD